MSEDLLFIVAGREKSLAQFTAAFARRLPEELRLVAWTSPTSFREPEIDNCWHPKFIAEGTAIFFLREVPKMFRAVLAGARRFVLGRFGAVKFFPSEQSTIIGITPATICTIEGERVKTAYCHPEDAARISWIVFEDRGNARDTFASRWRALKNLCVLLLAWAKTSFPRALTQPDVAVAAVLTLRWMLHLHWACLLALGGRVEALLLNDKKPSLVFGVHELWPWSRVVWDICKRAGVSTITFQHASITRSKLWYFPHAEELAAGMALPDTFVVFSQKERELLAPHFPATTRFLFGCGPRYAHWKEIIVGPTQTLADQAVLFVSSVPWWDNEVVLEAAVRLLELGARRPVIVRVHPLAVVPGKWRRWLECARAHGEIFRPAESLAEDLARCSAVVGMNSTVLEEAAMLGKGVVVLEQDHFLSFAPQLGTHVTTQEFSWESVERALLQMSGQTAAFARHGLGLDLPVYRLTRR